MKPVPSVVPAVGLYPTGLDNAGSRRGRNASTVRRKDLGRGPDRRRNTTAVREI